jgi:ATP-citrate lyase beta-subunit
MTKAFDDLYLGFLEINPYLVTTTGVSVLDVAIEVDGAATQLVKEWGEADFRSTSAKHDEEAVIKKMNEESSASFNLSVLNEDGSIFLLLSGGGASVVIADEIYSLGYGEQIANYGEYSGNPSRHETYLYTQQVLNLLIQSTAQKKVLFIGGAVANFTDIASTFNGIIDALHEQSSELQTAKVTVYVRRGGPRQAIGLKNIEQVLRELDLFGGVYDPSTSIADAVKQLVGGLS